MDRLLRLPDVLYGDVANPARSDGRWLARYLALSAVLALVVFARRPDALLRAQFWAEDGRVFFYEQLTLGFWSALWKLYVGFPFLVQRLVAALASAVPTVAVPLLYNASAIAMTALTMATFSLPGFRHLVRSDGVRAAVCIATVCVPAGQELLATPTTVGYFLAIWLFFLSVMRTPRTSAGTAAWCAGGALAVLSAPPAPLVAPLWMVRGIRAACGRSRSDLAFAVTQTAALLAIVALVIMRAPPGFGFQVQPDAPWSAIGALGWAVAACVDTVMFPVSVFERLEKHGGLAIVVPAALIAVCIGLAFRDVSRRGRVTICLGMYLVVSSLYLAMTGRPTTALLIRGFSVREIFKNDELPNLTLPMFLALMPRYRAIPSVGLLLVAAGIIDGARGVRLRVAAAVVACAGLLFAWTPEFRVPPFPDRNWPLTAAQLDRKLAAGSREPLVIPSNPPFWDTTLDPAPESQPARDDHLRQ